MNEGAPVSISEQKRQVDIKLRDVHIKLGRYGLDLESDKARALLAEEYELQAEWEKLLRQETGASE